MATIKTAYASSASFTITLNSLAGTSSGVGRESTVVDNTSNLYLDALCQLNLAFTATAPANDKVVYIYAYGGAPGKYDYPATGTDNAITLVEPNNLRQVGVINYNSTGGNYESHPFSIAQAFGGVLPPNWGIAVVNFSGAALGTTANSAIFYGITATSA